MNSARANESMAPFAVANCVVPRRLLGRIEKFLLDKLTGNISLRIKDGMILSVHIDEIVVFRGRN